MIGKRIAHYEVSARLGAGGMGEVYLARDTTLGRDVALKLLPAEMSADENARARLLNEARTASSLNHPHICTIFEVGEAEGRAYIALEHVEGKPLSALVPEGGLPTDAALRYGTQIADALAHAHERGVIHRDLKTSNVMITPDGRAKVLDFGLAKKLRDEDLAEVTRSGQELTRAGTVVGTLHAIAPEVLSGQTADARSDIWALGVLLYEMAAGALPFQGKTGFELTSAILREPPKVLPARVPAGLRAVIQRCLAKEPGQRYQRASEVRAALEAIRSDTTVAVARPDAVKPFWRQLSPLVWTVAVALLLIGVGIITAVIRGVPFSIGLTRVEQSASTAPADSRPRLKSGGLASKIPEANEYYERSNLIAMSRLDIPETQKMLERALELDPHFAEARAEHGFTYAVMLLTGASNDVSLFYKAEEEIRQALKDDPDCGRAHSALATIYLFAGRKELTPDGVAKALKANPNDVTAVTALEMYYMLNEDNAAAEQAYKQAVAINSLFFPAHITHADILLGKGDTAGAIAESLKTVEQAPLNMNAVRSLAKDYLVAGDLPKARQTLEHALPASRKNFLTRTSWALLLALEGKRSEALREMDGELQKYTTSTWRASLDLAEFYAVMGEADKAMEAVDFSVRLGDERVEWFQRDPLLMNVQKHPRFKQIIDSIAYRREQRNKK
jgi:serine/threonine protein kinase/Tfp pilus assembly protein PilF